MKKLLLVIGLVIVSISAIGQKVQDVVYLKNGSIVRGDVLELTPGETIKIETSDRSVFVYDANDVVRVVKEKVDYEDYDRSKIRHPRRGYRGFADMTIGAGFGYDKYGREYDFSRISLSTVHGIQYNEKFFFGAGVAIQSWWDGCDYLYEYEGGVRYEDVYIDASTVSIFADVRWDIIAMRCTPYLDLRLGGYFGDVGGFYFRPTLGGRFRHFNVYFGVEIQPGEIETEGVLRGYKDSYNTLIMGIAFDWGARH
ncbi:MAG: hypothetical protein Q4C30_03080 [Bacteroidia bacterium]|nr:hypothetical protein [Bacteroidia bacterium]